MIRRRSSRKLMKKSKKIFVDKTSDDDDDDDDNNNNNYGLKQLRMNKHLNANIMNDTTTNNNIDKNRCGSNQSNCSSGGTSSSASPFHRHSKYTSSTRSFSKSSLKQLLFSFKRFTPSTMTSDCDTQPSDFDPDDLTLLRRNRHHHHHHHQKRLKSDNNVHHHKNKNNNNHRNARITSSMRLSPFWKPKKSLILDQDNRRAISIPDLSSMNLKDDCLIEQMMSEPTATTTTKTKKLTTGVEIDNYYTQTEDDEQNNIGHNISNDHYDDQTKNESSQH
ncbi:hypothetical protein DERF_013248 [Dermatophagoides farinae]|uniref:Uncharacterized protein n=1 Tax=Dermatophagoides farinae TaxID=6954 RepID=A0A922HP41_DERFA|nr:hypothetical protein DERF_013248 [Dermatophagoides farinae]